MKEFNISSLFKNPSIKPISDMIEQGSGFTFGSMRGAKGSSFPKPQPEGSIISDGCCIKGMQTEESFYRYYIISNSNSLAVYGAG